MVLAASLAACASSNLRREDLDGLRAELRDERETQARILERLQRLEAAQAVGHVSVSAVDGFSSPPALTVIKLKPRSGPAPALDTPVAVVEPSRDALDEIAQASVEVTEVKDPSATGGDVADYQRGIEALKTGNIAGGVSRLLAFATDYPKDARVPSALYFAGIGQMGDEDFGEAAHTFERLLAVKPPAETAREAMLKLAECRVRLHQMDDAKVLYTQVVSTYPGTAAANQAEQRLGSWKGEHR
jgi:tol-pal system protein YbgF